MALVEAFLGDTGMTAAQIDRVRYLVGHHHTLSGIEGLDWQILVEADYIANASENSYSTANVRNFTNRIARTDTGKRLLQSIF